MQEALRVRETALFFRRGSGRHEEHLGLDRAWINWLYSFVPERRCLHLIEIAYHHPVHLRQRFALHACIRAPRGGVLTKEEVSTYLAIQHRIAGHEVRVIPGDLREPAVTAIALFLVSSFPIPCLEQTANVGREV